MRFREVDEGRLGCGQFKQGMIKKMIENRSKDWEGPYRGGAVEP